MRHPIRGLVRAVLVFEWGVLTTRIEPSDSRPLEVKHSRRCESQVFHIRYLSSDLTV